MYLYLLSASYTGSSSDEEEDINPRDKQQVNTLTLFSPFVTNAVCSFILLNTSVTYIANNMDRDHSAKYDQGLHSVCFHDQIKCI